MGLLSEKPFGSMLVTTLIFFWSKVHGSADWTYTGNESNPAKWPSMYPSCGGTEQSPIDISLLDAQFDEGLKPIRLFKRSGTNLNLLSYKVINNGHTITIMFPKETWFVSFADAMSEEYEVVQLHFHWGSADNIGSEHTLNGQTYSLETHLVCFNKVLYRDYASAATSPNGLAVLAFIGQAGNILQHESHLDILADFMNKLPTMTTPGSEAMITAFDLHSLTKQVNPSKYFRYRGSLTTPPCTQNVIWTVFDTIVPVAMKQMSILRSLKFGAGEVDRNMQNNFRPTQSLNPEAKLLPRIVYRSYDA